MFKYYGLGKSLNIWKIFSKIGYKVLYNGKIANKTMPKIINNLFLLDFLNNIIGAIQCRVNNVHKIFLN